MLYESNLNSQLHPEAHTEWKYLDAQNPDGWKIISIFYPRIGTNPATVSTYVNSPDSSEQSNHQIGMVDTNGGILISGQKFEAKQTGAVLKLDTPILKADLSFEPTIKPQSVAIKQNNMLWQIEMPRAKVTGHIIQNEVRHDFFGQGYHDHNWFNLDGSDGGMTNREILPHYLRGWQFGRLFGDKLTVVYGFSPNESHVLIWEGDKLIKEDRINRLTMTASSNSEKLSVAHPTRFDLKQLGIGAEIELVKVLSEKKLSVTHDGNQTGYIRSSATISDEQLGHLEGIHESWL